MIKFSQNQIEEINTIIQSIEKELKPGMEIGAGDKAILGGLLKSAEKSKPPKFFKCKREYAEAILSYFVKEKGVKKSRFSMNGQASIFVTTAQKG